jgi:hypothetical protein
MYPRYGAILPTPTLAYSTQLGTKGAEYSRVIVALVLQPAYYVAWAARTCSTRYRRQMIALCEPSTSGYNACPPAAGVDRDSVEVLAYPWRHMASGCSGAARGLFMCLACDAAYPYLY